LVSKYTTAESKRHREKKVTKLFYSRETESGEVNLDQMSMDEHVWPLWVDIEILFKRFREGVVRFRAEVAADPQRAAKVYDRVNHSYLVEVEVSTRRRRAGTNDESA